MPVTLEEQQEQLVSTPEDAVLFMARRSELRLTMKPRYRLRDPVSGQVTGQTAGTFIGFREGVFRCPKEGTCKLVDTIDGGESQIDAGELIEWLEGHRLYGNQFEGFWRVDPTAPPPSRDELQRLMDAAIALDEETLQKVIDQERAGWDRQDIITTAEKALERIMQVKEQLHAEAAAAAKAEAAAAVNAAAVKQANQTAKTPPAKVPPSEPPPPDAGE